MIGAAREGAVSGGLLGALAARRSGEPGSGPAHARAWVELDLEAVRGNVRTILRTADVPLVAVVKADAYGHGASAVAHAALEAGASGLAVASAAEALALRQAGVRAPVQILGGVLEGEREAALAAGAELTLHEPADLERAREAAWRAGRRLTAHLKVDVGMHRHGVPFEQALPLLAAAQRDPALRLVGLMTHLPNAASPDPAQTRRHVARFAALVAEARRRGLCPPRVHAAASAALFAVPEARFGQVRAGIALLGLDPGNLARQPSAAALRPALALRARVLRVKDVPAGAPVGYGGRWVAPRPSRLAIVGIGYGDGLPYGLSGRGAAVLLQGRRCPLVATVMMDYVLIDVTDLPRPPAPGEVATVVGRDGESELRLEEQAARAGLIPYAFSCGLGARLARVVRGARPAAAPVRRAA